MWSIGLDHFLVPMNADASGPLVRYRDWLLDHVELSGQVFPTLGELRQAAEAVLALDPLPSLGLLHLRRRGRGQYDLEVDGAPVIAYRLGPRWRVFLEGRPRIMVGDFDSLWHLRLGERQISALIAALREEWE